MAQKGAFWVRTSTGKIESKTAMAKNETVSALDTFCFHSERPQHIFATNPFSPTDELVFTGQGVQLCCFDGTACWLEKVLHAKVR